MPARHLSPVMRTFLKHSAGDLAVNDRQQLVQAYGVGVVLQGPFKARSAISRRSSSCVR